MKKKKDYRIYIQDIVSAIARIQTYTAKGKDEFFYSFVVQDAVIRQLSIIGEAVSRLPAKLRAQYPDIPWKQVIGMRNIIIHDYSETDNTIIWDTIVHGLPPLNVAVKKMLENET